MIQAVLLSALAACAVHAVTKRGAGTALAFFICAALMFGFKGLVDVPRPPTDIAYQFAVRWLERDGKNYGVFLILAPAMRTVCSYIALCLAERLRRNPGAAERFFSFNARAMLIYALIGVMAETINVNAGWWTWRDAEMRTPVSYFLIWIDQATGFFPFFLLNFLEGRKGFRRRLGPALYFIGFWGFLTLGGFIHPVVRQIGVTAASGILLLLGAVVRKGPALRPFASRDAPFKASRRSVRKFSPP